MSKKNNSTKLFVCVILFALSMLASACSVADKLITCWNSNGMMTTCTYAMLKEGSYTTTAPKNTGNTDPNDYDHQGNTCAVEDRIATSSAKFVCPATVRNCEQTKGFSNMHLYTDKNNVSYECTNNPNAGWVLISLPKKTNNQ